MNHFQRIKSRILITLALVACGTMLVTAQQDAQYTHYMFNTLVINPAYAGSKEVVNVQGLYRTQWVGIDGAPVTQTVSVDAPLFNKNVGVGLHLLNESLGARTNRGFYGTYSYRIKTGEDARLSLGLTAGIAQYTFDENLLESESGSDPLINGNVNAVMVPDADFGAYFQTSRMFAGISVNNLLRQNIDFTKAEKSVTGDNFREQGIHYFATVGYLFYLNEDFKFKPSILVKSDFFSFGDKTDAPTEVDFNAFFLYKDRVWLGAGYRTNAAIVGLIEYYVNDRFRIGYSYDYTTTELNNFESGSHEVMLGYYFIPQKSNTRMLTPRYF